MLLSIFNNREQFILHAVMVVLTAKAKAGLVEADSVLSHYLWPLLRIMHGRLASPYAY